MCYDEKCRVAANHVAQFSNGSSRFGPATSAMKISAIISVITRLLSLGRSCRSSARLGLGSGSSTRPAGFCTSSELNGPAAIGGRRPWFICQCGVVMARFGINLAGQGGKPRPPLLNARLDGIQIGQFRRHFCEQRYRHPCSRAFTSGAKRAVGPRKLSNIRGDNVSKRDLLASALTLSATGMIMPVAGQRADVSDDGEHLSEARQQ